MAIKFKCTCGHVLSVPDSVAGKSGKCPKCQKVLKVPVPGNKPAQPKPAQPKPAAATASVSSGVAGAMDSLFDEVGLVKKSGPTCPGCFTELKAGTRVCTKCGHNFETGQKMVGYDAKASGPEFDNMYLQEAANTMVRDLDMESRRDKSTMPWWVIMSYLIGAVCLCAAGVIIVDGRFGEPAAETTFIGKLQRLPVFTVLGATVGITGLAITLFAHLSICVFGFGKKAWHGLLCFFLPLVASVPYGAMHWAENKAPVKAILVALVLLGLASYLIVQGGGFGLLQQLR